MNLVEFFCAYLGASFRALISVFLSYAVMHNLCFFMLRENLSRIRHFNAGVHSKNNVRHSKRAMQFSEALTSGTPTFDQINEKIEACFTMLILK